MAFDSLKDKLSDIFKNLKRKGKLSESDVKLAMREIRVALLEADVNFKVVKKFVKDVQERAIGQDVMNGLNPGQMVIKIVNEELCALMGKENEKIKFSDSPPTVIMLVGLQGTGKTTTSAKLSGVLKKQGKKPMLVACDVQRPAAIKQLITVGSSFSVPVYFEEGEKDPVKIAKNAVLKAKKELNDVVIIDTAGRLHIDDELMAELENIKSAVNPTEILLVIDAMTGQEAVNVAENFDAQLSITGLVLTKLDGDSRGGAALSIVYCTGKPIKLIATGENITPLEEFHPDRMANRILGMGDIVTLVERAQKNIDLEEAKALENKMLKDEFSFEDFLKIQKQIKALGSFGGILSMLPLGISKDDSDKISHEGEKQFKKIEVFIQSMTPAERKNPDLLNASRKKSASHRYRY